MKLLLVIVLFLTGYLLNTSSESNCLAFQLVQNQMLVTAVSEGSDQPRLLNLGCRKSSTSQVEDADWPGHINDNRCAEGIVPQGIIGMDEFRKRFDRCHLDFDKQRICTLEAADIDAYRTEGYQEITSDFRSDGIYITILLRRKKYHLKLDTGFCGSIAMSSNDAKPFDKERCQRYEDRTGEFAVYPNKWITLGGNYYNAAIVVDGEASSKLGIGIIKGFNWIIDFSKREVYIKKNALGIDAENVFPSFRVEKFRSELVIASKTKTCRQFSLGDIVTTVNGQTVTSENICEIQELLNAVVNWDKIDIQTETRTKR